jgi:hypothetical protein
MSATAIFTRFIMGGASAVRTKGICKAVQIKKEPALQHPRMRIQKAGRERTSRRHNSMAQAN